MAIHGFDEAWIQKIKLQLKDPHRKKQTKVLLQKLKKEDLADAKRILKRLPRFEKALEIRLPASEKKQLVRFLLDQNIDPQNVWHQLKLYQMFR